MRQVSPVRNDDRYAGSSPANQSIALMSITGHETSSGTLQVLGTANVDGSIGVGRSGSLRLSGPDAVLHCSGNVFGASVAGGEIVVDDGAARVGSEPNPAAIAATV